MMYSGNGKGESSQSTTAIFSVKDKLGALDDALALFKKHKCSLSRIESRPSKNRPEWDYDFFVDWNGPVPDGLAQELENAGGKLRILETGADGGAWFPRKIADLDKFASRVLAAGAELEADHPGFKDTVYRERRELICKNALAYRHGEKIPRVEYTDEENSTWKQVYERLVSLYPTHACKEYQHVFPLLVDNCGYSPEQIPQLEDISNFLKDCTGFTLRPVGGLLSSRDFLNGLAFRVFHSTQYIRHHSRPFYTPEPDCVHELLGHVPLFADPDFADFSQQIGLASIGASDEFVEQLATCYWFTVEFGLCREGDGMKAYGAGLLSSFGELEYCLSDKPEVVPFDPPVTARTKYPITTYQPKYFVTESFLDATHKMKLFAADSDRPFACEYNPYTQSIEVLDSTDKLVRITDRLQSQISILKDALLRNDN